MKTCFDHNFSKSANPSILQISWRSAKKTVSNSNKSRPKFVLKKTVFGHSVGVYPAPKMACAPQRPRINQKLLYLLVFLILRIKNAYISCSAPSARVPLFFNLLFLERMKFWRRGYLQNWANRRFRSFMIETSFNCFY